MASFSVRAAGLLDLPDVVRLAKAAAQETGGWFGWTSDEAAARRFAGLMTGERAGWVLVAGDPPSGVLVTSVQPGSAMGEYLYVAPDARLKWNGALAALVRAHRKLMKLAGIPTEVVLAAPSKADYWQEHGYDLQSVVLSRTIEKGG